jgi:hypothetical protein
MNYHEGYDRVGCVRAVCAGALYNVGIGGEERGGRDGLQKLHRHIMLALKPACVRTRVPRDQTKTPPIAPFPPLTAAREEKEESGEREARDSWAS